MVLDRPDLPRPPSHAPRKDASDAHAKHTHGRKEQQTTYRVVSAKWIPIQNPKKKFGRVSGMNCFCSDRFQLHPTSTKTINSFRHPQTFWDFPVRLTNPKRTPLPTTDGAFPLILASHQGAQNMHLDPLHPMGPRPSPTHSTIDSNHGGHREAQTHPDLLRHTKNKTMHAKEIRSCDARELEKQGPCCEDAKTHATPIDRASRRKQTHHTHTHQIRKAKSGVSSEGRSVCRMDEDMRLRTSMTADTASKHRSQPASDTDRGSDGRCEKRGLQRGKKIK